MISQSNMLTGTVVGTVVGTAVGTPSSMWEKYKIAKGLLDEGR